VTSDPQADDAASTGVADTSADLPERAATGAPAEPVAGEQTQGRRSRAGHFAREVLLVGVTALVISFLIKTFVVQAFWIPSGSMEQTLVYGDRVMVSKIQAGPFEIERGDIAVFRDPGGWLPPAVETDRGTVLNAATELLEFIGLVPAGDDDHLIKRVIGVGGDNVMCCDDQGRITVNGVALDEAYLFPQDEPSLEPFDVVVPQDHFWMMGDHRSNSRDSRANDDGSGTGGSVPADHMVGQALALVWPLDRFEVFSRPGETFGDVPAPEGSP